ncbi:chromosome segregation protein ScpA [Thermus filiformis]|uniref:Chromosome segregation protein ScpA n=1 Tax=Thermus filiformis TaxID=276 RepID=A0A0A2WR20_THEFI|nr:chromosome segregation protein ScpA [Thermus filiformis]KGQ22611.1 chromosome segregation protein ScpA [Thermus filiformis]
MRLRFDGFEGSPLELKEALRRGRIPPGSLPVLLLVDQALAQLPQDLKAKAELLPLLAELLLFKLRPVAGPEKEEQEEAVVQVLVDLSQAVAFLEERAQARSRVLPVFPPPLPRRLSLPKAALARAALAFRRAVLHLPREELGLREVWGRIRGFLTARRRFSELPLPTWPEKAVGFAALLEAVRLEEVLLFQEAPFAELYVEPRRQVGSPSAELVFGSD